MKGGQRSIAIYRVFIVLSVLGGLGACMGLGVWLGQLRDPNGVDLLVAGVIVAIIIGTAIQVKILGDISWLIERENSRLRRRRRRPKEDVGENIEDLFE